MWRHPTFIDRLKIYNTGILFDSSSILQQFGSYTNYCNPVFLKLWYSSTYLQASKGGCIPINNRIVLSVVNYNYLFLALQELIMLVHIVVVEKGLAILKRRYHDSTCGRHLEEPWPQPGKYSRHSVQAVYGRQPLCH